MLAVGVPGSEYSPVQPDLDGGLLERETPSLLSAGVLGGADPKEIPKMVLPPAKALESPWSDGVIDVCADS